MKNLHAFSSHRDNTLRWFATYRIAGNDLRRIEAQMEIARRKKPESFGFRFHLGDRGSETPFDGHIDLGWVAFFWGFNAPGLGALCERIGQGHKRDLSLKIHGGQLWWKLWFDDDGGADPYHRCDGWRRPKVWPWSAGPKKHRGWMCLRDGNIPLHPLDALWGHRYYDRENIETRTVLVPVGEFPGDEYQVTITLESVTRARRMGPRWARRRTDAGWGIDWTCEGGIPFRNHSWKGDESLAGGFGIDSRERWVQQAVTKLVEHTKRDRKRYGYHPPTTEATG